MSGLTPEQIAIRLTRISASDVAPILGEHPSRGPWSVWDEKNGGPGIVQTPLMSLGLAIEPLVRAYGATLVGCPIEDSPGTVIRDDWASCTPDGVASDDGVEIKLSVWGREEWGSEGSDEVPDHYVTQCNWSMWVTGRRRWHLLRLDMGGWGAAHCQWLMAQGRDPLPCIAEWLDSGCGLARIHHYVLEYHAPLARELVSRCRAWWESYVMGMEMPAPTDEDVCRKALQRLLAHRPQPAPGTPPRVAALIAVRDLDGAAKAATCARDTARNSLVAAIDGHESMIVPGVGKVTHTQNKNGVYSLRFSWGRDGGS